MKSFILTSKILSIREILIKINHFLVLSHFMLSFKINILNSRILLGYILMNSSNIFRLIRFKYWYFFYTILSWTKKNSDTAYFTSYYFVTYKKTQKGDKINYQKLLIILNYYVCFFLLDWIILASFAENEGENERIIKRNYWVLLIRKIFLCISHFRDYFQYFLR